MCGCFCSRTFCNIFKKPLDNCGFLVYNGKAVKNAAIAQSVERILGKDEVASSNLASSSKKSVIPTGMADFLLLIPFELAKPVKIWGTRGALPKGRYSDPSEWQRSVCNAGAPSPRRTQGTATG